MWLKSICLLVLASGLIYLAPSSAVNIGGVHPHFAPISLSMEISSPPISLSKEISNGSAIHYEPIGSHIMSYQIGMATPQNASNIWKQEIPRYYFGRDFELGMIDSNYPGTPFLTQFLADP
jgi:hypothetical protein